MAANYASGAATSPTDLLNLLVTFLTTQGWTIDANATDGAGKRVHAHKGSDYINLRSVINEAVWPGLGGNVGYGIALYMGTGYSGASGWAAQAGGPIRTGGTETVGAIMILPSGAISAYHFFDDGADNIVVVVERSGGLFTHMGWGPSLKKSGTWTGGAYFFGSNMGKEATPITNPVMGDPSNGAGCPGAIIGAYSTTSNNIDGHAFFVRADVDSFTGKWIACSGNNTTSTEGYTGKLGVTGIDYTTTPELIPTDVPSYQRLLLGRTVSAFNSQSLMLPVRVHVNRDAGGYSFIGEIPNVFACSASPNGGVATSSILTIGSRDFMVFPHFVVRKFA